MPSHQPTCIHQTYNRTLKIWKLVLGWGLETTHLVSMLKGPVKWSNWPNSGRVRATVRAFLAGARFCFFLYLTHCLSSPSVSNGHPLGVIKLNRQRGNKDTGKARKSSDGGVSDTANFRAHWSLLQSTIYAISLSLRRSHRCSQPFTSRLRCFADSFSSLYQTQCPALLHWRFASPLIREKSSFKI